MVSLLLVAAVALTASVGEQKSKECFERGALVQDAIAQHCHDNEELDSEGAFAECIEEIMGSEYEYVVAQKYYKIFPEEIDACR